MVTIKPMFLKAKPTISVAASLRICASSATVMNSFTRMSFFSRSAASANPASRPSRISRRISLAVRRCGPPRIAASVFETLASIST